MAGVTDGAEYRPGCLAGRLLGGVARLVLAYPLISIGSQLGQTAQHALQHDVGTPFEGALIGIIVGLLIGLSLWRSSLGVEPWPSRLAEVTLVTVTVIWLASLVLAATTPVPASELVIPWAACLAGSAGIAIVLRR